MIPYFVVPPINILGLEFHWFTILMALGFLWGLKCAKIFAKIKKLPLLPIYDLTLIFLTFGLLGAHLVHVTIYHPEDLNASPWALVQIWNGLASSGGFLFGAIGGYLYLKRKKLELAVWLPIILFGLANGMLLGRLGCALAHDHPGKKTQFFLAVAYPGGARHDLGLYEMLVWLLLLGPLWLRLWKNQLGRSESSESWIAAWILLGYSLARFFLEFLRADDILMSDRRISGLTPAQWFMIPLIFVGLRMISGVRKSD